ncbi:MAG TPA: hypothetical protein VIP82_20880 [Microbacterium sp.]|uniref:hypothetical protein n=1 Tax=Microbacterium sp. TaxID=51671 RepID=UPI002F92D7AA
MTATTPLYATCSSCRGRVVEVRWDWQQDLLIGEPRLEPVALDYQQVTACVIAGIPLWQLHEHAGRPVTSRRTRWWPKRKVPGHILPEHACGRVWDAFPIDLAPDPALIPETCPF